MSPVFPAPPLWKDAASFDVDEARSFSQDLQKDLKIPVLLEPPGITSVTPVVEHVLPRSPARRAESGLGTITEVLRR